jgi:hypothetical protein
MKGLRLGKTSEVRRYLHSGLRRDNRGRKLVSNNGFFPGPEIERSYFLNGVATELIPLMPFNQKLFLRMARENLTSPFFIKTFVLKSGTMISFWGEWNGEA